MQSDNLQPFYVQMGDKVYSSSAIGHVVIANLLPDNTCTFEVGFPQQTTRPQRFSIPLSDKDHGYQLVKAGGAGWALYDWQTKETIKPEKGAANSAELYGERKKDDAFASLMAAVVNDTAVLYTSIVKKDEAAVPVVAGTATPEEKKQVVKEEEKPAANPTPVDTARVAKTVQDIATTTPTVTTPPDTLKKVNPDYAVSVDSAQAENVVITTVPGKDSAIAKYDPHDTPLRKKPAKGKVVKVQQQTKDGQTKMVFVDSSQAKADVVTIYIDHEKPAAQNPAPAQPAQPTQPATSQPVETSPVTTPAAREKTVTTTAVSQTDDTEPAKKEEKTATKEDVAEKIKKETWQQAPAEKKTSGDTTVIILESRQMKKDTVKTEPLYRPKPAEEPAKNSNSDAATQPVTNSKPDNSTPATAEKPVAKTEPVKPATDVPAQKTVTEPVKPAADVPAQKATTEPAVVNKKDSDAVAKQTPDKPITDTKPADTVKKVVMEPIVAKKDTVAAVPKPDDQTQAKAKMPAEPEKKTETPNKLVMINSDCVKLASDNDVDKLRVKMLAVNEPEKRMAVANKGFKAMCLYAKQIKALTELFPTDETKFQFLQMAYPFAADNANFKQLYDLFTDAAYQAKFKAMVHL